MPLALARQLGTLGATALAGALAAVALGVPVPLLTGPALLGTGLALAGLGQPFPVWLRNIVFLLTGITIGAGVSRDSLSAIATWPLAFAILGLSLVVMMLGAQAVIRRGLGTDRSTALLAATPGHLSFVIGLGEDLGADSRIIVVVQAVRLLALTLLVPIAAGLAGIDTGPGLALPGQAFHEMTLVQTAASVAAAMLLYPLVRRTGVPAPVLMAGMVVGAAARLSGLAPGGLSHWISFPALALIGTLIGSRFAGIRLGELRRYGAVGLGATLVIAATGFVAAALAAGLVDMPLLHVLVAFAPGGLETMAVIGVAIGANPGFVAAAHVLRLLILSALVPTLLARSARRRTG